MPAPAIEDAFVFLGVKEEGRIYHHASQSRAQSLTSFNNGLEASSDSDDEDKLHIVEEETLQEPDATANATAAAAAAVANGDKTTLTDASQDASAVLAPNGSWNGGRRPEMAIRLLDAA
ncbi:unnamed protein product [Boreogadus saida]